MERKKMVENWVFMDRVYLVRASAISILTCISSIDTA